METKNIELIRTLPLSLLDRAYLLLVHADKKPTTLINMRGNVDTGINVYGLPKKRVKRVEEVLDQINLPYLTSGLKRFERSFPQKTCPKGEYQEGVDFFVGQLAGKLKNAYEDKEGYDLGRLLGYPETAIQAHQGDIPRYPDYIGNGTVLRNFFAHFIFSAEHFEKELQTSKRWHDAVKKLSPKMYGEIEKYCKNV